MIVRSSGVFLVTVCVVAACFPVGAWEPRPEDKALTALYFHGVTEEICFERIGVDRLPRILELMEDPEFPRRDNLVAFLAYLGDAKARKALIRLIQELSASPLTPEEDRARLLAPQALGKIASRGDRQALGYLERLARGGIAGAVDLAPEARIGLGWADGEWAEGVTEIPTPPQESIIDSFDGQSRVHDSDLTYANHVDIPNKMDNSRLDTILEEASLRAGRSDYSGDVACCITVTRLGNALSLGSPGDGLDRIDSSEELNAVLGNPVSRVKVVRAINHCGGPGFNIIGCASTPGSGMAVVRMSGLATEAILWIHEYGHNTGLPHASDSRRIMYGTDTGNNRGLSQGECDSYHNPFFLANPIISDTGACTDFDGDEVQDGIDNCPDDANNNQADADGDGTGDVCDGPTDSDGDGVPDDTDCAPFNNQVTEIAGEADDLFWTAGSTEQLNWTAGNQATESNLYRGTFDTLFHQDSACLGDAVAGSSYTDPANPPSSTGFHYLVTGENQCGESSAGQTSGGTPRSFSACP